ncbi:MAG: hypothetical protein KHY62_09190 [Firmicutes bacterium]|nr:hypothetical protein [Bacillota bacterium]
MIEFYSKEEKIVTDSKKTKRELAASIVSLTLCLVMLVGLTFAWFTDSVTNKGNIIKAGNLDVAFEWADGKEALDTAAWKDASGDAIFNYDAWEPGYTEARHVRISNKGNLALKYEIKIVPNGEVSKLAEVIDVYYIKGGQALTGRTDLVDANKIGTLKSVLDNPYAAKGHILAGGNADVATIALKMQESAGNDYKGLSIGADFSIQLVATQYTNESDSFGSDYDANAGYPVSVAVSNQADLDTALNNPGVPVDITLTESIKDTEDMTVTGDVTLNLGDKALNQNNMDLVGADLTVANGGSLIINAEAREGWNYTAGKLIADGVGSSLTVNGGEYGDSGMGNSDVAARNGSIIYLNSGSFETSGYKGHAVTAESGATVYIKGGKYGTSGANSSTVYANGGTIVITALDSIRANGKLFDAVNGGKIVIAKTAVSSKPTSIGAGCTVSDDGENWVITGA